MSTTLRVNAISLDTAGAQPAARPWWAQPKAISVALALVVLLSYLRVWNQQFINFDDNVFVSANPYVRGGLTLQGLVWAFGIHGPSQWHPLTWLSHMADVQLFGMWAGGHKLHNVALHAANVVLLFHVLRLMTGKLGPSVLVAAIFGLHPQRVEAVAWVAERKEVLSAFFGLWTLLAYWWYTRSPSIKRYAAVAALFGLTLLAKPLLVTLPFVFLLLDYWPLRRFAGFDWLHSSTDRTRLINLVLEKLPLLPLMVVSCSLTLLCQADARTFSDASLWPLPGRLGNAVLGYVWYIRSTLVPMNLAVLYPLNKDLAPAAIEMAIAILVLITWMVLRLGKQREYLRFGWFFFLGTLVPAIGLVQVGPQRYADRYSYISSIGLLVMLVWSGRELIAQASFGTHKPLAGTLRVPGPRGRVATRLLLAALLAVLTLCTVTQLGYWRESLTLFARCVDVEPHNSAALNNLGVAFEDYHDDAHALVFYREALAIDPTSADAIGNIGNSCMKLNRYAEAATWFRMGIRTDPMLALNYGNLGATYIHLGEADHAVRALLRAIELQPYEHQFHESLGVAFEMQGNIPEAIREFEIAVVLSPESSLAHVYLALEFFKAGQLNNAVEAAERAVKLDPHQTPVVAPILEAWAARNRGATAAVETQ